jgi:hypothetical protein
MKNSSSILPETKQFHYKGDAELAANSPVRKTERFINGINALKASLARGRSW